MIVPPAAAGDVRVAWDDCIAVKVPGGTVDAPAELLGDAEEAGPALLRLREEALHKGVEELGTLFQDLEPFFHALSPKAPDLDFSGVVEVIGTVGIDRIAISVDRQEMIGLRRDDEVLRPNVAARIQEPPATSILERGIPASPVAEAASVKAVLVAVDITLSADR
jgi:hypothetical protein